MRNSNFVTFLGFHLWFLCATKLGYVASQDQMYIDFYNQPEDAIVVRGESIMLNCAVGQFLANSTSQNVTLPAAISWLKDSKEMTLGGVFTRRTLLENGSLYISRATFTGGDSDSGTYMCKVNFQSKVLLSRKAEVKVAVFNRFVEQPTSTSKPAGSYIRFNCTFGKATPAPVVTWYKDGESLGDSSMWDYKAPTDIFSISPRLYLDPDLILNDRPTRSVDQPTNHNAVVLPNGMLEISNVSSNDAGRYYCTAENQVKMRRSNQFTFTVTATNGLPVQEEAQFIHQPRAMSVVFGETSFFECAVKGHPSPIIKWFKNSTQIDRSNKRLKFLGQGNLVIDKTDLSDDDEYSCVVDNVDPPLISSAKLTVLAPPHFLQRPKHVQRAHLGCKINFYCNASGNPTPYVSWFKDGTLLEDSSVSEITNNKLSQQVRSLNDAGIYQCFAQNDVGQKQATFELVIVKGNTSESSSHADDQLRLENITSSQAHLSWDYFGLSSPTGFKIHILDVHENRQEELESTLPQITINGLTAGHIMQVNVVPQTPLCDGPPSRELTFTVPDAGVVSGMVRNFAVDASSSFSIYVMWDAPASNETLTDLTYKLIMEEMVGTDHHMQEVVQSQTTYDFQGLKKYTLYGFKVAVLHGMGSVGPFTPQLVLRTGEDVPDQAPGNLTATSESSDSAYVRWSPPLESSINGQLLGYKIKYKDLSARKTFTTTADANATYYKLEGLRKSTEYVVRIQAFNRVGQGPFSKKVYFETPRKEKLESSRPGKPRLLDTQRFSQEIVVMWVPPEGSIHVREYIIGWGKKSPHEQTATVDTKQHFYRITNLEPSTQYFISVRAGNRAGRGMQYYTDTRTKAIEETVEELYPPLGVHITVLTPTTLNVTWHDPDKKKQSRYYVVRYKTNVPDEPRVRYLNATDLNCLIHGLRPHTLYEVAVRVVQGSRKSTWSMTEADITMENKPGSAPTDLTVMPFEDNPTVVQLNWQPPEEPNGELNGYLIFYTTDPTHDIGNWVIEAMVGDKLTINIEGLTLDTQYYFKALARNRIGVGPYSELVDYRTPKAPQVETTTSSWNMPNWMWYLIIGGIGLLVISVVIIATLVICKNRRTINSMKQRKQKHASSHQNGNGVLSLASDSWARPANSVHSGVSMRHHRPEENMELRSLANMDGRYGGDFVDYRCVTRNPTEMMPLTAMSDIDSGYCRNYPYPSHHSNLNDLLRSPAPSEMHCLYPGKEQYGNGVTQLQPMQQHDHPRYDMERHYPHSNGTNQPAQDYAGDSAYGSDHPAPHNIDDRASPRHVKTSSSRKNNHFYQDKNQVGSSRSSPLSDSLDSARESRSISVESDEMNDDLANVVEFVRDMRKDGLRCQDLENYP